MEKVGIGIVKIIYICSGQAGFACPASVSTRPAKNWDSVEPYNAFFHLMMSVIHGTNSKSSSKTYSVGFTELHVLTSRFISLVLFLVVFGNKCPVFVICT